MAKHFAPNELLDSIEGSRIYTQFQSLTRDVLQQQWEDIMFSGIINSIYDRFMPIFKKRNKGKVQKFTKFFPEDDDVFYDQNGQPVNPSGKIPNQIPKLLGGAFLSNIIGRKDLQNFNTMSIADQNKIINQVKNKLDRKAINRAILSGDIARLDKLQRFIKDQVTGKMKKIGGYEGYGMSVKQYIYKLFEKGGQEQLDKFLGRDKVKFRLSKQFYRDQIKRRANTLLTGMDETTANKVAKQLILGMDKGESKQQLVKRLTKMGKDFGVTRSKMIVQTETAAAVEYMRLETAKLNGVQYKTWNVTYDERLCHVCGPLGELPPVRIYDTFPGAYQSPPVHPRCRCWLDYNYDDAMPTGFVLKDYVEKAKKMTQNKELAYQPGPWKSPFPNPEAVWAGGEKLVGKDSKILTYYEQLRYNPYDSYILSEAKDNLTELGFLQLITQLKIKSKIDSLIS